MTHHAKLKGTGKIRKENGGKKAKKKKTPQVYEKNIDNNIKKDHTWKRLKKEKKKT